MRQRPSSLLLLAALISAAMAFFAADRAKANELLVNGGFENGTQAWTATAGELTAGGPPYSGSVSGKLAGSTSAEVYQWVKVAPGWTYEFSGWLLKSDANSERAFLRITWLYDGGSFSVDSPHVTIAGAEWQAVSTGNQIAPAGATDARAGIVVQGTGAGIFDLAFDDLSFFSLFPPTPAPTPNPTPTPQPPPPPPPVPPPPPPAPAPTSTPTPQPEPSPTPAPGDSPTPTVTPSATPTATASATPSPEPNPAPEPEFFPSLVNGSFEIGRADGTPYGWHKFGGTLAQSAAGAMHGFYAAELTSATPSTKWIFQTVTVEAHHAYVLSGYTRKDGASIDGVYLRISWYSSPDGSGTLIDSADSTQVLHDEGGSFGFLSTGAVLSPENARSAKLRLIVSAIASAPATAYFDAITFHETNPPSNSTAPGAAAGGARGGRSTQGSLGSASEGSVGLSQSGVDAARWLIPLTNAISLQRKTAAIGNHDLARFFFLSISLGFPIIGSGILAAHWGWVKLRGRVASP